MVVGRCPSHFSAVTSARQTRIVAQRVAAIADGGGFGFTLRLDRIGSGVRAGACGGGFGFRLLLTHGRFHAGFDRLFILPGEIDVFDLHGFDGERAVNDLAQRNGEFGVQLRAILHRTDRIELAEDILRPGIDLRRDQPVDHVLDRFVIGVDGARVGDVIVERHAQGRRLLVARIGLHVAIAAVLRLDRDVLDRFEHWNLEAQTGLGLTDHRAVAQHDATLALVYRVPGRRQHDENRENDQPPEEEANRLSAPYRAAADAC